MSIALQIYIVLIRFTEKTSGYFPEIKASEITLAKA